MKLTAKPVVIIFAALILVGVFIALKPKSTPKIDQAAVAACQKQVATTYTSLLDTASLTAPGTTATIQKQEQDAKNTCVSSNTH